MKVDDGRVAGAARDSIRRVNQGNQKGEERGLLPARPSCVMSLKSMSVIGIFVENYALSIAQIR